MNRGGACPGSVFLETSFGLALKTARDEGLPLLIFLAAKDDDATAAKDPRWCARLDTARALCGDGEALCWGAWAGSQDAAAASRATKAAAPDDGCVAVLVSVAQPATPGATTGASAACGARDVRVLGTYPPSAAARRRRPPPSSSRSPQARCWSGPRFGAWLRSALDRCGPELAASAAAAADRRILLEVAEGLRDGTAPGPPPGPPPRPPRTLKALPLKPRSGQRTR